MNMLKIALGNKVPAGVTIDPLEMIPDGFDQAQFRAIWEGSPALRYIVDYGWKQTLNDAIAGIKLTDKDYSVSMTRAIVEKKINAILGGTVKAGRTVVRAADPIAAEARHIAEALFKAKPVETRKAAIAAMRATDTEAFADDAKARAAIIKLIADTDGVKAQAAATVAARQAAPSFDLAALMAAPSGESDDDESDELDESDESEE